MKPRVYPLDERGLPMTIENDGTLGGGDSAAIWGTVATLKPTSPWLANQKYYIRDGQPVRHPVIELGGHLNRFSRDQMISVLTAGIVNGNLWITDELIRLHRGKWYMTAWNTIDNGDLKPKVVDPTLFQVWALELRYKFKGNPLIRLLLHILDLENFFGTLIILAGLDKTRVRRNHMLVSYVCARYYPTLISLITNKINPYKQMVADWDAHCRDVEEYSTGDLFEEQLL